MPELEMVELTGNVWVCRIGWGDVVSVTGGEVTPL